MRASAALTILSLVVACSGCMSDVQPSNAGKTFTYDCSGAGHGWGDCTDKATAQCGSHNYTTVSQDGGAQDKGGGASTEMKRVLVVTCK